MSAEPGGGMFDYLGYDLVAPDGWSLPEDTGSTAGGPNLVFKYPAEASMETDAEAKGMVMLQETVMPDARVITALLSPDSLAEFVGGSAELAAFSNVGDLSHFSFWTDGSPIKGVILTGTVGSKPYFCMVRAFPSVNDRVVFGTCYAPLDGSVDISWYLDIPEARYPEVPGLGLGPQPDATDAPAQSPEPEPTATPKPDVAFRQAPP